MSLCVFVCVCACVCGVSNIKLVKCKIGICLFVHVSVCGVPTYKLSIFGIFANEPKSVKCEIF